MVLPSPNPLRAEWLASPKRGLNLIRKEFGSWPCSQLSKLETRVTLIVTQKCYTYSAHCQDSHRWPIGFGNSRSNPNPFYDVSKTEIMVSISISSFHPRRLTRLPRSQYSSTMMGRPSNSSYKRTLQKKSSLVSQTLSR